TVNFSIRVGSGIGPRTCAPVRLAVFTISRVDASRIRWSKALSRIRIFWPFICSSLSTAIDRPAADPVTTSVSFHPAVSRDAAFPRLRGGMRVFFLLDDARDDAGADGASAFADGEAQLLLHGDRHD